MTGRVLIVTSAYSPAMVADMHRTRWLAWELPCIGWQVEILAPDSDYQHPSCLDADAAAFFAPGVSVHSVRPFLPRLFRALRIGSIGWRALVPMYRAGARLLRAKRFDLVYISTAQSALFLLGPAWKARHAIPYVLDFHDPGYKAGGATPVWASPSLKHSLSARVAKRIESLCTRRADGLISVSPHYVELLRERHGIPRPRWLEPARTAVIPFAAAPRDFEGARDAADLAAPAALPLRIIYVGAGGPVMARSFELLCKALAHLRSRDAALVEGVRFELRGTTFRWQPGDTRHLQDIASRHGLASLIDEDPSRVTYKGSIDLIRRGDGLLVLGVDDRGYMPSKLFNYAMTGKPLLAILRRDGSAFAHFAGAPRLGVAVGFDAASDPPPEEAAAKVLEFLGQVRASERFDRSAELAGFTAASMALRHARVFAAVCGR